MTIGPDTSGLRISRVQSSSFMRVFILGFCLLAAFPSLALATDPPVQGPPPPDAPAIIAHPIALHRAPAPHVAAAPTPTRPMPSRAAPRARLAFSNAPLRPRTFARPICSVIVIL